MNSRISWLSSHEKFYHDQVALKDSNIYIYIYMTIDLRAKRSMKISYTRTVLFNCSSRREWWSGNTPTEISMRWIKHKWEERTLLNAKYNRKYTLAKSDLQ